jgi:RHS repeat-associated protein
MLHVKDVLIGEQAQMPREQHGLPDFVNLYDCDSQDRLIALWPTRSGRALAAGIVDDRAPATSRKQSLGLAASRIGLDGSVRWMPRACPVEVRVCSYERRSPARGFLSVSPATAVATASPPPSRAKRGFREGRLCSCQRNHLPDKPGAFGYTTGDHNRLLSDGTYNYEYDAEGNRTRRTEIVTGEVTEYHWDHRNRLIRVSTRTTDNGLLTTDTSYVYDTQNRWIARSHDSDGDGPHEPADTHFVYEANQIILQLDATGTVTNRYLWGPAVDQILADEQITDSTVPGNILWPLTDHLNTVRDLAAYDADTGITTIVNHLIYDAYGRLVAQSNPDQTTLFAFTARPFDPATGLQNNLNRWYDPVVGRWLSEDPIGFQASDANFYRYVDNMPTVATDPSGLLAGEPVLARVARNTEIAELVTRTFHDAFSRSASPTKVELLKPGTIVVLLGHGKASKGLIHTFEFRHSFQAAAFIGCDAKATNDLIQEECRLRNAPMTDGDLERYGRQDTSNPKKTEYWEERVIQDAKELAKRWFKDPNGPSEVKLLFVSPKGWAGTGQPSPRIHTITRDNVDTIVIKRPGQFTR